MPEQSPHVKLALAAISAYVRERVTMEVPKDVPDELVSKRAGAFVSLHRDGSLRGCIGTIEPTQDSLAEEIIANAISAATRDPRFLPLEPAEIEDLECSVDVLTEPELVSGFHELDPKRYGVIVESGMRRGLLLPDLEGVDTVEDQVQIARRKAYVNNDELVKLYRFQVVRHH